MGKDNQGPAQNISLQSTLASSSVSKKLNFFELSKNSQSLKIKKKERKDIKLKSSVLKDIRDDGKSAMFAHELITHIKMKRGSKQTSSHQDEQSAIK